MVKGVFTSTCRLHQTDFLEGSAIEIKVNGRDDTERTQGPIACGIAVSLEVSQGIDVAVYDEVKSRIAPVIEIQT